MKLITLNTCAGLLYNPLEKFVKILSKDIKVNKFAVMEDVVSDHLPLFLDFS